MQRLIRLFLLLLPMALRVKGACNRVPQAATGERSAVDDNFKILIDGNPATYVPDHQYNVSLSCPINLKFVSFTLVIETEDQTPGLNGQDMTGHFELLGDSDTRFSVGCENMVESTNTNAKTHIEVSWIAPSNPDSGCVLIKAGVVQHRDVWFLDDGFLTKRICPEEIDEINSMTPTLENCCACDEAKYEIVLERKWARNTHAKDFPAEAWRTRLGEVIGASHSHSYRYWAYGGRASQGMKEMAEHGATRTLENEIRENTQNGDVRTIIKAPGIPHRLNAYGTTLANARVDPLHHQISLAAKIDPSPDWILGVAGLELCLSNCTWLERKVLNLYPWDIGTDSGPSYMSADQPQVPPDVVRRITSSYPSDYRSPFYDDTGASMKPLATLYLTRKKLYIRECEEAIQEGPLECAVHPWNEWSNCSARCGQGYSQRFRSYKNPNLAANFNCERRLDEMRQCQGTQCGPAEEEFETGEGGLENPPGGNSMAECQLSNWGEWSPCSKTCGRGLSTRTRDYYNPQARQRCLSVMRLPMEETRQCMGSDCGGTIPDNGELDALPEPGLDQDGYEAPRTAWNNRQWNSYSGSGNQAWNRKGINSDSFSRSPYNAMDSSQDTPNSPYGKIENQQRPGYNLGDNRGTYDTNRGQQMSGEPGYPSLNTYSNDRLVGSRPQGYDYTTSSFRQGFTTRSPYGGRYPSSQQETEDSTSDNANGNGYNVVQDYCFQKPYASTSPCLALPVVVSNYWFYDHEEHECKIFTTDNCDENKNRFRSLMACEGTCLQPQMNMEHSENDAMDLYGGGSYGENGGGSFGQAGGSYGQAGGSYGQTGGSYGQSGNSYGQAASSYGKSGGFYGQKSASYGQTSSSYGQTPSSYGQTASSYGQTPSSYGQTGSAYGQTQSSYGQTGGSYGKTGSSYGQTAGSYGQNRGGSYGQEGAGSYGQTRGSFYGQADQQSESAYESELSEAAGDIGEPMSQTKSRYDSSRRGRYGG